MGQHKFPEKTDYSTYPILQESKESITYLTYIYRDNRIDYNHLPHLNSNDFFLIFYSTFVNKTDQKIISTRSYSLHVMPDADIYKMKIRLDSYTFYTDGKADGHASPSGKWKDCDDTDFKVLEYYLTNKEKIMIFESEDREIDTNSIPFTSLLCISKTSSDELHLLSIVKNDSIESYGDRDFTVDTELLAFDRTTNAEGKLLKYSVTPITIRYILVRNILLDNVYEYHVKKKCGNATEFYPNGTTKEVKLNEKWESFDYMPDYAKKVLEYYQTHKSEINGVTIIEKTE